MKFKARLLAIPLLVMAMILGVPQIAQAAYTYIFYHSGDGTMNVWYFSAYQNDMAGGYVGTYYNDGYVTIQTQNAYHAYSTGTGVAQTYLSHPTVDGYRSACRFYGGSVWVVPLGCQWRVEY